MLAVGLAACGSSSKTPEPPAPVTINLSGVTAGYMVEARTVEIAAGDSETVGDITFSCAAGGADCTIMVAADGTATSTGGMASAANSAAYQARATMNEQRTSVDDAIKAAETAVMALMATSSDTDADAAQTAIEMAEETLSGVTSLSASEVLAFQESIDDAKTDLATARTTITNYRRHGTQYSAAMDAVDAAQEAVAALTEMSDPAEAEAARGLIEAAKRAVAAGTMLTADEMAMLNGDIATAEGDIATAETTIANYRMHGTQYADAMEAADEATRLVGGLTAMSSDEDVMAAQKAIEDAEAAVAAGTHLTDADKAALNGRIAIAKVDLGTTQMAINGYRMGQTLLSEARGAVDAAEMAVAGLTEMSEDEDVMAAKDAIEAAEAAVAEVTDESEAAALTMRITTAKTVLGAVETRIATYKKAQTASKIVMLHGDALKAISNAEAAGKKASDAVENAKKYSLMLNVAHQMVQGDSTKATMHAQMVLDARDARDAEGVVREDGDVKISEVVSVAQALAEANAALERATKALASNSRWLEESRGIRGLGG